MRLLRILLISAVLSANVDATVLTFKTVCSVDIFTAFAYCDGSVYCKRKGKGITYNGDKVRKGIIAVDKKVIKIGSVVQILYPKEVAGFYVASDTGGRHIRGKVIDIWMPTQRHAIKFGKQKIGLRIINGDNEH